MEGAAAIGTVLHPLGAVVAAKGIIMVVDSPDTVTSLGEAGLTRQRLSAAQSGDSYGGSGRSRNRRWSWCRKSRCAMSLGA